MGSPIGMFEIRRLSTPLLHISSIDYRYTIAQTVHSELCGVGLESALRHGAIAPEMCGRITFAKYVIWKSLWKSDSKRRYLLGICRVVLMLSSDPNSRVLINRISIHCMNEAFK
jgi:hypothetical protein